MTRTGLAGSRVWPVATLTKPNGPVMTDSFRERRTNHYRQGVRKFG